MALIVRSKERECCLWDEPRLPACRRVRLRMVASGAATIVSRAVRAAEAQRRDAARTATEPEQRAEHCCRSVLSPRSVVALFATLCRQLGSTAHVSVM
eukprot:4451095-Prymnesium_polylepis.1